MHRPQWLQDLRRSEIAWSNRRLHEGIDVGEPGQVALDQPDLGWLEQKDLQTELGSAAGATGEEARELIDALADLLSGPAVKGSGPIAPTFDEFDRDHERQRGGWVVVPSRRWERFVTAYDTISD